MNNKFEQTCENIQTKKSEDFSCDGLSNTRRGAHLSISTCIDYFKFRVDGNIDIPKTEDDFIYEENGNYEFIQELCKILLLNLFSRVDQPAGFLRYAFFSTFDEDVCVFGGRSSECTEDGITRSYVELKGHALRMFEIRCQENNIDVFSQYKKLFDFCYKYINPSFERNLKMLRIDTSIDDYSNLISIMEIQEKFRNGFYVSKCRTTRQNIEYDSENNPFVNEVNKNNGWTFYIGGRTSRQLCIYDKKAERESKGNSVVTDTWIRYEGRFYQDNAHSAFMKLYREVFKDYSESSFNECVCSLISHIVEFKEDNNYDHRHQSLANTWTKWEELLGIVGLENFKSQGDIEKDITFHKSKKWLINSPYMNITLEYLVESEFEYTKDGRIKLINTSIPKLFDSSGLYFDDRFLMFILQLLIKGKKKLDYVKLSIANNMRSSKGRQKINTIMDAAKLIDQYVDGRGDFHLEDNSYLEEEE